MNEFSAFIKEAAEGSLTPSSVLSSPQPGLQREVRKISFEIHASLCHWFVVFYFERERAQAEEQQSEKERERESQAGSCCQHRAQCRARIHEP